MAALYHVFDSLGGKVSYTGALPLRDARRLANREAVAYKRSMKIKDATTGRLLETVQYLKRKGSRTRRDNPGGDDGDTLLLVGFLAVAAFFAYKNGLFSSIGIGTSLVVPGDAGYVGQTVSNLPTAMLSTYAQLFAGGVAPSSGNVYWSPSTQKAYASSSSPTAAQISAGTMGTPAQLGWAAAMGPLTSQLIAMQNPGVTGFGNYWSPW